MKKLLLMAAIMLASVGAYAQHAVGSFNLQPKVGINIANYWCPLNRYNDLWNPFGLKESRSKHYATSPSFNFVHFQEGLPKLSPMLPPNPFPGVPRIHERQYST